jgi:arylsulfatase A-like enzyme
MLMMAGPRVFPEAWFELALGTESRLVPLFVLVEHDLFDHGESLYSKESHVPLLIVPPAGKKALGVVRQTVSLRDLPATIVELAGLADGSPFPGRSWPGGRYRPAIERRPGAGQSRGWLAASVHHAMTGRLADGGNLAIEQ